jgi:hypothetical protein
VEGCDDLDWNKPSLRLGVTILTSFYTNTDPGISRSQVEVMMLQMTSYEISMSQVEVMISQMTLYEITNAGISQRTS